MFLASLQPNKFTAFFSFEPEKYYWFPVYKQIQLGETLEDIYYNFGRFYFRCRTNVFLIELDFC
jgi:hypothetical protein